MNMYIYIYIYTHTYYGFYANIEIHTTIHIYIYDIYIYIAATVLIQLLTTHKSPLRRSFLLCTNAGSRLDFQMRVRWDRSQPSCLTSQSKRCWSAQHIIIYGFNSSWPTFYFGKSSFSVLESPIVCSSPTFSRSEFCCWCHSSSHFCSQFYVGCWNPHVCSSNLHVSLFLA